MPNTLTLDSQEFNEMVSQWQDGGKYYVTLEITQTGNDGTTFTATVDEVTDYGDSEMEHEMPPKAKGKMPPMPPMPPKKMPGKVNVKSATPSAY